MEILESHGSDGFGENAVRSFVTQNDYNAEVYTSVIKMFITPITFLKLKYLT